MAPSTVTHTINCEVLLMSLLGQDTRRSRTFVGHLRASFGRKGYTTTLLEKYPSRSDTDPSITESKVAVVVISENFASSPWCLESLVEILDFHHSGLLALLIPVFYEIDPLDVKYQIGKLHEQFSSHEIQYSDKVQRWRQALSQFADVPGGHYSEIWRGDAELIGKITDDIWDFLIGAKSIDFCGLVGMDRHMKALYGLLDLRSMEEVRWIHLWGKHGMGKTELAKYLYEDISHHFDTHIWLDIGSRFINRPNVVQALRFELEKHLKWDRRSRLLLVLDNVHDFYGIYGLERQFKSFGRGSRVIITTEKNKTPLRFLAHHWYEVLPLETSEALPLFCLHAFKQSHLSLGFEDLSSRAVSLTGRCPGTIKKLGLGLSGKTRKEWEAILSDYESSSDKGIIDFKKINLSQNSSVTSRISSHSRTVSNFDGLVGMEDRMKALSQLLELGSDKEVRVVGIWGIGGIGKTTLARYACKGISNKFHTNVFLENSNDHHSSCLEKRFLSTAMKTEAFAIRNAKDSLDVVKSGLRHNKVLLIVDGVEHNKALEDVHKMAAWFQPGSRIIVTTRDESLLFANGVKRAYEVKNLRFDEALQLFYHFALKQEPPSDHFRQLAVRAIKLVGFHPLALKVTASMFFPKDMDFCETILQKLSERRIS